MKRNEAQQKKIFDKVNDFRGKGLSLTAAAKKANISVMSYYAYVKKFGKNAKTTDVIAKTTEEITYTISNSRGVNMTIPAKIAKKVLSELLF